MKNMLLSGLFVLVLGLSTVIKADDISGDIGGGTWCLTYDMNGDISGDIGGGTW